MAKIAEHRILSYVKEQVTLSTEAEKCEIECTELNYN